MLINLIFVIFPLFWISSRCCNPNETCFIDVNNENIKNLLASMDYFTNQLIHNLYNPNLQFMYTRISTVPNVISPMSAYVILVLMLLGSAGNTQRELIRALHFPDTNLQQLKISFGDILIATDAKRSEMIDGKEDIDVEGHVATGLFIQKDFTFVRTYADYLSALNIKIQPIDFLDNTQNMMDAIYRWIQDSQPKSDSWSSSCLSSSYTRMYLTSLFYFTAKWSSNLFLDKSPGPVPFTMLNNEQVNVKMMKASASLLYYDNKSYFTAVEIPYEENDFAAVYILPKKGVDSIQFLKNFTVNTLKEFSSRAELKDIDCQIPTVSYTFSFRLNNKLEELGIRELFGEADLSNMLNLNKQYLGVQIAQEIQITINEKGANADNLNVVPVKKNPPSANLIPFIADHPFLMLIRSTHSNAIVFAMFYY